MSTIEKMKASTGFSPVAMQVGEKIKAEKD
jgi:hypothetical protein